MSKCNHCGKEHKWIYLCIACNTRFCEHCNEEEGKNHNCDDYWHGIPVKDLMPDKPLKTKFKGINPDFFTTVVIK